MPSKLEGRLIDLRSRLNKKNIFELANRCGANILKDEIKLRVHLFNQQILIIFPELQILEERTGEILPEATQTLLLYYLITADGEPLGGRWISFSDLPDGRFYERAFQGYTGGEMEKKFGGDLAAFEQAGHKLGGIKIAYGDSAFAFHALPRVMISIVYHRGDDEFPATCRILFDISTSHYLPTDVCAVLGSMLTKKILAA
jgi:hypothetical protein